MSSPVLPTYSAAPAPRWMAPLHLLEDHIVGLAMILMILIPAGEVLLRSLFHSRIPASVPVVQHLVLVVGMLGGALAARENRLLTFAGAARWIKGGVAVWARIVANGLSAAVSALLCGASARFVISQKSLGKILAYGIPVWVVESLLVAG
ncbi:MAG: TRAP transporter small permease subunit, partial [Opitutaceae bacterium]